MEFFAYGTQIMMILGVAVAFYVALIKPQLDRISSDQTFLQNLQLGDAVVTAGGIIGKIVRFEGDEVVVLALSDALQIRVVRSGIASFFTPAPTQPTASASEGAVYGSHGTTA